MSISLLSQNFALSRMAAVIWRVISSIFVVYSNQTNYSLYVHPRILHLNRASAKGLPGRSDWEVSLKACAADYDISSTLALLLHHRRLLPHFDVPPMNSCNDHLLLLCLGNSYCMPLSQQLRFWRPRASYAVSPPCSHSHLDCWCYLDSSLHHPPPMDTAPRFSYVDSLFL